MFTAAGLKLTSVIVDYQRDYIDSGKGMRQGYFNKDTVIYGGQQSFTEVDELSSATSTPRAHKTSRW